MIASKKVKNAPLWTACPALSGMRTSRERYYAVKTTALGARVPLAELFVLFQERPCYYKVLKRLIEGGNLAVKRAGDRFIILIFLNNFFISGH